MSWDPAKAQADLEWLQKNPAFIEKPASIREFVGVGYLNIERGLRPGVLQELVALFGEEVNPHRIALVRWAMFTGAIGIGKTTMASIVIPYMVHWVLCLKSPQEFYELLPGSRIAFMQMSTSEEQAKETVFGDIKARMEYSDWFKDHPWDPAFKNQLRFEKDIWVLPGSSLETSFEGYNILGGILDEADSHKVTKDKDYGEVGWDTINGRIDSRFQDKGFLLTVGQMKKTNGFAASKYKELLNDPVNAHTVRMTIWESLGWKRFSKPDGTRDSFWYDTKRKKIVDVEAVKLLGFPNHIIEIPAVYRKNFANNPEKAMRDLAGIPPLAGSAFISRTDKVEDAVQRWIETYGPESPVSSDNEHPDLAEWFRNPTPLKRAVHLDIGLTNDAAAISIGHVSHLVDTEEEVDKPYFVIDATIRIKVGSGRQVMLSDLRNYIYDFSRRGFRINHVTMDGFQSVDTQQQLRKKKYNVQYLSIDKSKLPYEDLRDAIYEDRISLPPYVTYVEVGDTELVQIGYKEVTELEDDGKKIDHPSKGSKDVADTWAGVVTTLAGTRQYVKGMKTKKLRDLEEREGDVPDVKPENKDGGWTIGGYHMPGVGAGAPIPDNVLQMPIPSALRPRR